MSNSDKNTDILLQSSKLRGKVIPLFAAAIVKALQKFSSNNKNITHTQTSIKESKKYLLRDDPRKTENIFIHSVHKDVRIVILEAD